MVHPLPALDRADHLGHDLAPGPAGALVPGPAGFGRGDLRVVSGRGVVTGRLDVAAASRFGFANADQRGESALAVGNPAESTGNQEQVLLNVGDQFVLPGVALSQTGEDPATAGSEGRLVRRDLLAGGPDRAEPRPERVGVSSVSAKLLRVKRKYGILLRYRKRAGRGTMEA